MKCPIVVIFIMALFCASVFSHSMLSVKAEETAPVPKTRYYTSLYIQEGDSLWSIASRLKENSPMTTIEYMEDLKRMNGLRDETIRAGQYLTVVYFE